MASPRPRPRPRSPIHQNGIELTDVAPNSLPHAQHDRDHESMAFLQPGVQRAGAALNRSWSRFTRKGKKKVGILQSIKAIVLSSWLNLFLIFVPLGWAAHFKIMSNDRRSTIPFALCFLAVMPLEKLFEYGGEQMACYLGRDLGDLLVITLNNIVEATLAIVLLAKGELRLLQAAVIGVVILHLLLVPGMSFLIGGARLAHQELHPRFTQLNQTLLSIGVLTFVIPAAIFAALDRQVIASIPIPVTPVVSDTTRATFLVISRILSIVLLVVYVFSRIFLHNPPGEDEESRRAWEHDEEPEVNQYVCVVMLIICIGLLAATIEWLTESVDLVRETIELEWFGLILLPFLSFAADGVIAAYTFIRFLIRYFFKGPEPPNIVAKARAIDLSIQFMLFWMPFFVVLAWTLGRPLSLLFDFFEISVLVCACFVVNYVTADSKTNWAEGLAMIAFYIIIAACAWHYPGQQSIGIMLAKESVEEALLAAANSTAEA
ncbi:hypothetical protein AX15_002605 [Amanita polypyramis BW_CC]|nr:hypothetical protein AX15_002605 [Amanita polypyramis BW_CC]